MNGWPVMSEPKIVEVDPEVRRRQEEAYVYLSDLLTGENFTPAWKEHLRVIVGMASETAKFQGLLGMMNRAYLSLRNRKNAEIAELEAHLDKAQALLDDAHPEMSVLGREVVELRRRLEEATATIVLACELVEVEHPAWVVLDGYDGSGDNPRELLARGYQASGDGGWYAPDAGGMWKAGAF
jgi:hypothetical protein